MISLLCNRVLWTVVRDNHSTSLHIWTCEPRGNHRRVHPHLWLHWHHWIPRVHAGICRHRCPILHLVTDILFVVQAADLFDFMMLTVIIVFNLNDHNLLKVLMVMFKLYFRCAAATEDATTDATARSICAFRNDNQENDKQEEAADYRDRNNNGCGVNWAVIISIVGTDIDHCIVSVTVVVVSWAIVRVDFNRSVRSTWSRAIRVTGFAGSTAGVAITTSATAAATATVATS